MGIYKDMPLCGQGPYYVNSYTYTNHDGPWLCCSNHSDCTNHTAYYNCYNEAQPRLSTKDYSLGWNVSRWDKDYEIAVNTHANVYELYLHLGKVYYNLSLGYNKPSATDGTSVKDIRNVDAHNRTPEPENVPFDYVFDDNFAIAAPVDEMINRLNEAYKIFVALDFVSNENLPDIEGVKSGEHFSKDFLYQSRYRLKQMQTVFGGPSDELIYFTEGDEYKTKYKNYANCRDGNCAHFGYPNGDVYINGQ